MDAAEKVAKLREIADAIERAWDDLRPLIEGEHDALGPESLALVTARILHKANSIERRAKPIAIGDTIEVRFGHGYRAAKIKKVAPVWITAVESWGRESRHRRDNGDIHPDDRARLDACFPRRAK